MNVAVTLKAIHVGTVLISISLFTLRCFWVNTGSGMIGRRWVRIVPHVNDTVLLTSAIVLAASYGQYPFVHGWLTAKVLALLLYIALGMVALKYGKTLSVRMIACVLAYLVFFYIVSVAITRHPMGAIMMI